MIKQMRRGIPSLFKEGTEHLTGTEAAVVKNLRACKELADITRTSLGPNGMNKLIVNHLDKIFVTSDCATIMKEMEIAHPAAKLVVMAASMQETEVGDGSNFVVVFAGELLTNAEALIRTGLLPGEILAGYAKAAKKCMELFDKLPVWTAESKDMFSKDVLLKGVQACIGAKQPAFVDILSGLVAEACLAVMPKNPSNFVVDNVRIVKMHGGNITQSEVIRGMVVPHDTVGSVKRVKDAKIAVFQNSVQAADTETKGTVLIQSASELINFNSGEEKQIEKLIKSIADSGVQVVVTGGNFDDMALHFMEKFGLMGVKITSKFDLRRLCKAVRAKAAINVGAVPAGMQGYCSSVYVREIGAKKVTVFAQEKSDSAGVATILLRSSTENSLNDFERALDDGVNVVRAMTRDGRFVAGAGGSEIELARQLAAYGRECAGMEQYSIKKFAEAFEAIPRTLAENAGLPSVDVIAQLYAAHERGQTSVGVNVNAIDKKDGVSSATDKGILDLLYTKQQAIRLAVDAVLTVLRVDQIIMAKPSGGPKLPQKTGGWDDD